MSGQALSSVSSVNDSPETSRGILKRREVLAYGAGDVAASLVWNAVSAFALIFYTDVALLPAAALGTLFFFTRIFDAFFDVAIGLSVDRTSSRWGKARPYLLYGAVPFAVLGVATFYVPDASENMRFLYAAITYFLLVLLLSVVTIPYSAMLPMMSSHHKDTVDLSAARSVATSVGVIVVTALFLPGVEYFGQGDAQQGYLIMAAIVSAAALIMLLTCFSLCKERVQPVAANKLEIKTDVSRMFRNRAWNIASGFALLNFIRFGALLSLTPFFAINVLQQPWTISVLLPALSGTLLVGAFIARPFLSRFGTIKTDSVALIAGAILFGLLPLFESEPVIFLTLYVLSSLVISITMTSIYAMAAEAVDYHQALFGTRQEGLLAAGVSLAIKIGMAVGTAGVAWALAFSGYSPQAVPENAISTMRWLYYGLPLVVFALQFICIRFYPADQASA